MLHLYNHVLCSEYQRAKCWAQQIGRKKVTSKGHLIPSNSPTCLGIFLAHYLYCLLRFRNWFYYRIPLFASMPYLGCLILLVEIKCHWMVWRDVQRGEQWEATNKYMKLTKFFKYQTLNRLQFYNWSRIQVLAYFIN